MPYANNKGADQPAHLRSLISTFVVRCLDSTTPLVVIFEISRLQLASVAEQLGLNLTWSKILEDMLSRDVAQLRYTFSIVFFVYYNKHCRCPFSFKSITIHFLSVEPVFSQIIVSQSPYTLPFILNVPCLKLFLSKRHLIVYCLPQPILLSITINETPTISLTATNTSICFLFCLVSKHAIFFMLAPCIL